MNNRKPKKPAAPTHLATLPSGPAPSVVSIEASPAHGYIPRLRDASELSAPLVRRAVVTILRGEDEVYYGLVEDETFDCDYVSDADLSDMEDEDIEDAEDEASAELLSRFAMLSGAPLDLPPQEAFRVLTAVQKGVYALRSRYLAGVEVEPHRVHLLRPLAAAAAAAAEPAAANEE